jgi:hypothetical protein
LIWRGKTSAALVLPIGIGVGCVVFYRACQAQLRWLGFVSIAIVLVTAYAAYDLGK